jgi:hypothetical protein
VRAGVIRSIKVGKSIRVPKDAIITYLTAQKDKDD